MKAVFIIEKSADGFFSCYTDQEFDGFALLGYGNTAEEAKNDLLRFYKEIKEENASAGKETPDIEFEWKYDLQSFFDYFGIINVTKLAQKAGINPSQLRQYRSGLVKANEKQYAKLRECIRQIGHELSTAKL